MIIFSVLAALLVLLALAILLPPLLRMRRSAGLDRDDQNIAIARERLADLTAEFNSGGLTAEQYEEARRELEVDLYQDLQHRAETVAEKPRGRWAALVVAVAVPATAGVMYLQLGDSRAIGGNEVAPAAMAMPAVDELVAKLAARMESQPDDLKGWIMLGRSYKVLERYPEAVRAFEKAYTLAADDPDVMLQYADALAMVRDGNLGGKPIELVMAALALRPDDLTGLWLAGMARAQEGDFKASVDYWRRAEELLTDDPESQAQLRAMIVEAERRAGVVPAEPSAVPAADGPQFSSATGEIRVEVSLSQGLEKQAAADDTLFVYAQALSGPPMPLAIVRKQVKDLPLAVTLSDAMAMMPAAKLSNHEQVRIVARVSKTADAMPKPGDLIGRVEPVSVDGSETVRVVIDDKIS